MDYDDTEWGVPEYDSRALFEKLNLDAKPIANRFEAMADVPAQTPLSKERKKESFKFCGPTIVYAFMEAVGMANDHMITCPRHCEVVKMAR